MDRKDIENKFNETNGSYQNIMQQIQQLQNTLNQLYQQKTLHEGSLQTLKGLLEAPEIKKPVKKKGKKNDVTLEV